MKHLFLLLLLTGATKPDLPAQFRMDMMKMLRQLGSKPIDCPQLEFKQLRLCASMQLPTETLKTALQRHKLFQPSKPWLALESSEWRSFKFNGHPAFLVLSPLPGGATMLEVGLGRFVP